MIENFMFFSHVKGSSGLIVKDDHELHTGLQKVIFVIVHLPKTGRRFKINSRMALTEMSLDILKRE
jgi:hypothetical protein